MSSGVWRQKAEKVSSHYYFALKFRRSQNVRKYANWVAQRSAHKTVFSSLLCNDCDNFMFNLETNATTTELQTIHRNFREFLQIQRENAQNAHEKHSNRHPFASVVEIAKLVVQFCKPEI